MIISFPAGWSKRSASDARTKLADFFTILLGKV
jgi:hypothetical protein